MNDELINKPDEKNYISCITWVKRGIAAAVPDKIELTADELRNVIKDTRSELHNQNKDESDSEEEFKNIKNEEFDEKMQDGSENATDEFNFEKYDEESGDMYCNLEDVAVLDNEKDQFIIAGDSDDDSEKEDDIIKTSDNLILVGHVADEASILEVHVYNECEGSFYCHHHDYLPYIPLCFEWLNFDPAEEKPGNLCAIGNDSPIIDIWDLDVIGSVDPVYKLGKKPNKRKKIKRVGHKDAVLDLAWNTFHNHVLASASADCTTILWDLENGSPSTKLSSFDGIVQSINWHPKENHMLLTGSMDKKVRLFDCKTEIAKTWQASGEVEKVIWNHFNSNTCFISTDNGYIECIDIRHDKPLWKKNVQKEEIAGLSLSSSCSGLLFSSNKDGTIKVWDVMNHLEPELVFEKQSNLGQIICLESSCDDPFIFAAGGDNKAHNLNVFDFSKICEVSERFKKRGLTKTVIVSNLEKNKNIEKKQMDIKMEIESTIKIESVNNLLKENKIKKEMMDVTNELGSIALESHNLSKSKKKKKKSKSSS